MGNQVSNRICTGVQMYNRTMRTESLDQLLLPLADQFEAGNEAHWYSFAPGCPEDIEPLRECMAELYAEGSVLRTPFRKENGLFQFTAQGYKKYLPRIKALRAMSASANR